MEIPKKLGIALKGFCMGIADVIPGVSGGTLALILGIYQNFIDSIKSINPSPVFAFLKWVASGFKPEPREKLKAALGTINLGFLIPLGLGIGLALIIGAATIPTLMERFPEIMRGLFFGLILASIAVPWKMMPKDNRGKLAGALVLAALATVAGYTLTDPNSVLDTTSEWIEIKAPEGEEMASLKDVVRRGPSALTTKQVYWSENNAALRDAVAVSNPELSKQLADQNAAASGLVATDKKAQKALAAPYDAILVPAGTPVNVPRPAFWFVFVAGSIAICAMVLPGVSGSFLLLVMGVYYFVLNALKGAVSQLIHLEFPVDTILYVTLFVLGVAIGLLTFARVMSFLLKRFPALTMGVLVGLMIGCLRGIWPFQQTIEGKIALVMPASWGAMEIGAVIAAIAGAIIVTVLSRVGDNLAPEEAPAE